MVLAPKLIFLKKLFGTDKNQNFPIFEALLIFFDKRYKKVNVHS